MLALSKHVAVDIMYVINSVSPNAYIGWRIDCKKIRSMNTIKLGKNEYWFSVSTCQVFCLGAGLFLLTEVRFSVKSTSISVHKLFNISLGLEPTSLNPTQDMQIVLLSIFHRALCPLAANSFYADRKCACLLKPLEQTTIVGNVPVLVLCSGSFGFLA
jgi:hypothetical protein